MRTIISFYKLSIIKFTYIYNLNFKRGRAHVDRLENNMGLENSAQL